MNNSIETQIEKLKKLEKYIKKIDLKEYKIYVESELENIVETKEKIGFLLSLAIAEIQSTGFDLRSITNEETFATLDININNYNNSKRNATIDNICRHQTLNIKIDCEILEGNKNEFKI